MSIRPEDRLGHYLRAMSESKAAMAEYNAASRKVYLTQIHERNAELASQSFETVADGNLKKLLGAISDREREIGIAFARYATYGRTD